MNKEGAIKKPVRPSKISEWLLNRLSKPGEGFSTLGDFEEIFKDIAHHKGTMRAQIWYSWQIFLAVPPYCRFILNGSILMFKNYIKIALRNLKNHKVYSLINIFGLSLGITCCILIMLFVQYELSYDAYHENADQIYRVSREWFNSDGQTSLHLGHVAPPGGTRLIEDFPEIEMMVRFTSINPVINYDGKVFPENNFFAVDKDVFKMFSWRLIKGDPETALAQPNTVVLSELTAKKYFQDEDPMGKMISFTTFGTTFSLLVTGVVEETPANSHVHFNAMMSMESLNKAFPGLMRSNWGSNNWSTYVMLPENYDIDKLEEQMPDFMKKNLNNPNTRTTLHFWKLTDIHLHSNLDSEIEANSDILYVYIFSVVAFFILLIACFNFMNLSTARSTNRAKEVGMRKVVGAYRNQLVSQFLSESVMLAVFSLVIAVAVVMFALPYFNNFVNSPLEFDLFNNITLVLALGFIVVFVGFLAGSYPAFFLSSFRPASVLKGEKSAGSKSAIFRTVLAAGQFAISIILLIGMGVVGDQLDYIRNKRLGYNKEHLINFQLSGPMRPLHKSIKNQILDNTNFLSLTASSRIPTGRLLDSSGGRIASADTLAPINFRLAMVRVDLDYFNTFGMEMAAGRDFSHEILSDTLSGFIINENAALKFGWNDPNDAVEKAINYGRRQGKIIGVVKDFHFESLRQPIVPIIFYYQGNSFRTMTVRVRSESISQSLEFLEQVWNTHNPNVPFTYNFVDDNFENLYTSERRLGQIFGTFSILAVVIACLGLFGLASFSAERKIKEIGIRKVLGATVPKIIGLLSKEFVRLLVIANVIAWPIAYFALNKWFLQSFAYKTGIDMLTFIVSGIAALGIALVTVGYQAVKAALSNPVKSLRAE